VNTRARRLPIVIAAALTLVGCIRIASTYRVFSNTYDEPAHLAAGMEWWSRGEYTYEEQHPPLARIAVAMGPYLNGVRSIGEPSMWNEGYRLLDSGERYRTTLALARLGILPFFVLGCAAVFLWARWLGGEIAGAAAVGLFSLMPPVLAHAGMATTDFALAATLGALFLAFSWWLERPGAIGRGALLGLAGAAALCAKFSSIPYFGLTVLLVLLARVAMPATGLSRWPLAGNPTRVALAVAATGIAGFVATWAVYRFSLLPVRGIPLPLREIVDGIRQVAEHNDEGHQTYLLGRTSSSGSAFFFPVVLLVKTPLALLASAGAGVSLLVRRWWRLREPRLIDPILASLGVLGAAMAANINLGVRYVLPLYVMLAVIASMGITALWRGRGVGRVVAALLVAWLAVDSARAHPDYLAYFNELARRDPGAFAADSDLDWGQDVDRLAAEARRRGIADSLTVAVFRSGTRAEELLPNARFIGSTRGREFEGWLAISETWYRVGKGAGTAPVRFSDSAFFAMLDRYQPVARIGKSIRLYELSRPSR
jgi:hypothetical protein